MREPAGGATPDAPCPCGHRPHLCAGGGCALQLALAARADALAASEGARGRERVRWARRLARLDRLVAQERRRVAREASAVERARRRAVWMHELVALNPAELACALTILRARLVAAGLTDEAARAEVAEASRLVHSPTAPRRRRRLS